MSIEECAPESVGTPQGQTEATSVSQTNILPQHTNSTEIEFSGTTVLQTVVTATMAVDLGNTDYSSLDETAKSAFISSLEEAIFSILRSTMEGNNITVESVTIISIGGTPVRRRLRSRVLQDSEDIVEFSVQVTSPCTNPTCQTDGGSIGSEVAGALGDEEAVEGIFAQSNNAILQQATTSGTVSITSIDIDITDTARIDTEITEDESSSCSVLDGASCLITMQYLQMSEVDGGSSWCSGPGSYMSASVCGGHEVVSCFNGADSDSEDPLYHYSCDQSALPEEW